MKTIIGIWDYSEYKKVKVAVRAIARLLLEKYPFADILKQ
jgi:hypothetical protein